MKRTNMKMMTMTSKTMKTRSKTIFAILKIREEDRDLIDKVREKVKERVLASGYQPTIPLPNSG